MAKRAAQSIDVDEILEDNDDFKSRLDRITGAVQAAPEGASEAELNEILDLVYDLATGADSDTDDDDDLSLDDEEDED